MSRHGYSDYLEQWDLIRWRGAVAAALRGKRGQAFLRELLAALDALPEPRLTRDVLIVEGEREAGRGVRTGAVCALGAVGLARGLDMSTIEYDDAELVAEAFSIARAMAAEIEFQNDDGVFFEETPEQRFVRVRAWVEG